MRTRKQDSIGNDSMSITLRLDQLDFLLFAAVCAYATLRDIDVEEDADRLHTASSRVLQDAIDRAIRAAPRPPGLKDDQ